MLYYQWNYYGSVPTKAPGRKIQDGAITVPLQGFDLSIQAQNLVLDNATNGLFAIEAIDTLSSRLPIWFEVAPRATPVRVDPSRLRVLSSAGDSIAPFGYWGSGVGAYTAGALPSCRCGHPKPWPVADLAVSYRRRAAAFDTCLNCIKKRAHQLHVGWPGDPSLRPMTGPITVTQPTCFVVLYDRPARDYDFTLRLDGFQVGDTLVLPQEISFKRGEYLRGGQPW
jgi:hypothetical protein